MRRWSAEPGAQEELQPEWRLTFSDTLLDNPRVTVTNFASCLIGKQPLGAASGKSLNTGNFGFRGGATGDADGGTRKGRPAFTTCLGFGHRTVTNTPAVPHMLLNFKSGGLREVQG